MKAIKLAVILVLAGAGTAAAQAKKTISTVRIKTSVECDMCKKSVESYLKREEGITYANVNYHNKIATVKYYTDRTNPENIRTAIANAGYDADTVTANPDAYNRLEDCCKKGGMERLKEMKKKK